MATSFSETQDHQSSAIVTDEDFEFLTTGTPATPRSVEYPVHDEDQFEALMVSCSSGTGFVFEMMMYWQDWIEEHGFSLEEARLMTIETFVGASLLAAQAREHVEDLQARVTSKKGVTAAGLQSMRELEIERALRISFEKAAMRNKEMAREIK